MAILQEGQDRSNNGRVWEVSQVQRVAAICA
jgi:hypothetical protein